MVTEYKEFAIYTGIDLCNRKFTGVIFYKNANEALGAFKAETADEFIEEYERIIDEFYDKLSTEGILCGKCEGTGKIFFCSTSGNPAGYITCKHCHGFKKVLNEVTENGR